MLVNGLGATPLAELFIMFRRVAKLFGTAKIRIHRSYVGEYKHRDRRAGRAGVHRTWMQL
jgi:dihydroxyacetone kinase